MTVELDVDGRRFTFGDEWKVTKYDEWNFYRTKFQGVTHAKAVDLVAIDASHRVYLIEVKDYTDPGATAVPLDELPSTVAAKCRDTLSGLATGQLRADGEERDFSRVALQATDFKIVLHIELSTSRGGRLSNPQRTLADLQTKLRSKVKAIDPHARVEHHLAPHGRWSTQRATPTSS